MIDDKGRLFGRINLIDALVVLLVLTVIVGGTTFVLSSDTANTQVQKTQKVSQTNYTVTTVQLQSTSVQPFIVDAIEEGPSDSEMVIEIRNKSVKPTEMVVRDQNGSLHLREHPRKKTVTLELALNTTVTDEGRLLFKGDSLEIGSVLIVDLGDVAIRGRIISAERQE